MADWRWAYLQILVRFAQELLHEEPTRARRHVRAKTAQRALATAIPELEKRELLQPQSKKLYGLLAKATLERAKALKEAPRLGPARAILIARALVYARYAVEKEPESAADRLVLLEVLALVSD